MKKQMIKYLLKALEEKFISFLKIVNNEKIKNLKVKTNLMT